MDLDNIQTEKDLLLLKEKVKEIEKKIKENNKPKTITISGNVHNKIKKFCGALNLNIGEWSEKVLLKEIEDNNCLIVEEDTEDTELKIKDKYIKEEIRPKYLIKSNKLIFSDQLKFEGYSYVDTLPIYEFSGDMTHFKMNNNFDELGLIFNKVEVFELTKNIKTNKDLEDYIILNNKEIN